MLGFGRVAVIAYLLGTHSLADSLAVAMGPLDTLNGMLINSMLFAFVPMLTARERGERAALFRKLCWSFVWVFAGISIALMVAAPWLMRLLAPGLDAPYFSKAVTVLRILSLSTLAAGLGAIYCALLYTDRRFAPTAFYQAALNAFTIIGAVSLWKLLGVYAFAVGYTAGACAQLGIVYFASRGTLARSERARCDVPWRAILSKPAYFVMYASGLALNITFTRAYATQAGPGMAAALDYCMRGVGVPLVLLVNPIGNSLLPEIARLRSLGRLRDALRLIDRTIGLAALAAVAMCSFALLFRTPAIQLMFQRGSFTAESTQLVSAVFLGLAPSLVGWSLIEITSRTLFALDRPWPPLTAAAVPVLVNVLLTLRMHSYEPQWIGVGASSGLMAGFVVIFVMAHLRRKKWLAN
ncbi:MAG TPA: lipid II flippase MurJ [Bryobacteraceae bacterium]|nr:lipid II flippase MurJ [Bryobacteraceae bacterium]